MHGHDHAHGHGSGHGHDHGHGQYTGNIGRAFAVGIALNIVFVVAEFVAGKWYNSMGLLADAGHNLSDVGGLAISMAAFHLAAKRSTPTLTYGYRKSTILASLFNALLLFGAVVFIIYECVEKFIRPAPVGGVAIMVTAGIGIVINGLSVALFLRDKERDINIKGAYLHMLADTLVSVGVVVSGAVVYFSGWTFIDPLTGLAVAAVIIVTSWSLLRESVRLSLDGIPGNIDSDELMRRLRAVRNVSEIHHSHLWAISTTENAMTAHVVLNDFALLEATRDRLREEAAANGVTHTTFEFENTPCGQHDLR